MPSSKPDKVTTTSQTEPWADQKPRLTFGFQEARDLYDAPGPTFFPGSTVSPFAAEQQEAQGLAANRARTGNPLMGQAGDYTSRVMGGEFLNAGNPHLANVFSNIQSQVMPAVNSQFSAVGRYGSGAHADTMTRALSQSLAPFFFGNYETERGHMADAARFAPEFAAEDYRDIGMLDLVGMQKQQLAQREIEDAMQRHAFVQDLPQNKLQDYMATIGGAYGGSTTSQQPYFQTPWWQQALGGGLGLLGAGLSFL